MIGAKLIFNSPLTLADLAISKCWNRPTIGSCNVERIERVANKNRHSSTIEHLTYTFDITCSRAVLQELVRHRHASISVKSSRYTLRELKAQDSFLLDEDTERAEQFVQLTTDSDTNTYIVAALENLRLLVVSGTSNDTSKFAMPEAYLTSFIYTINARSLQNFLMLRTSKSALWAIKDLAYSLYDELPKDHVFLFRDSVNPL